MEEKRECYYRKREAKEREFGDESMHTVLFTAGTAVLMACLKRFIMMFFIEQWRIWVFLLLNVVLLAIFFTSMPSSTTPTQDDTENVMKKKPQCGWCAPKSEESDHVNVKVEKCEKLESQRREEIDQKASIQDGENENEEEEKEEEEEEEEEESPTLSKEELNERVEAFIATFRRHLISDAIRGRDQHYCFSKKNSENGGFVNLERRSSRTSMNFSTPGFV